MSSGVSYPVFRTSDPAEALAMAWRLLALGEREYAEVSVEAELRTVPEVLRLRRGLPDAWFRTENDDLWASRPDDPTEWCYEHPASELSEEPDDLGPMLPIWVSMPDQSLGSVEESFAGLAGANFGSISWRQLIWPQAPERGYDGRVEHDRVTLVLNCNADGTDLEAGTHTVCIGLQRTPEAEGYAAWLAGQVGRTVIGPPYDSF
ncbi:hypothetical protein AB0N09_32450 [Streptomyces erythrochromogenes]|uniref:hypothetical protein n=1 Tax=Streptomyces erythrochromogenes TaxID=285574 RepID=UPI00342A33D7